MAQAIANPIGSRWLGVSIYIQLSKNSWGGGAKYAKSGLRNIVFLVAAERDPAGCA
jgi:hypothetical protein